MHPSSHYRNHAHLPSRSPSTVLDRFAFFQPDIITSSKSVYSGRPTQAPQRSPANSFSQFFFTSVSSNGSHSMKLKIPKVSPSSKSNHPNLTIKSLPSTLYDDPAFSPDPLSHPFFVTNHDPAWASPAAIIHSPSSSFSLNSPALDINTIAADKPSTSIPPNTSTLPDKTVGKFYSRKPSSHTSAYESQQSLTSLSPTSPSTESHQSLVTEFKPVEVQKKKNSLTMFWQKSDKSDNTSKSIESEHSNKKRQESPPSYDTIFSARPAHSRGLSAPELRQSVDRPTVLPRPATTTVDPRLPPPASKRNTGAHPIRAHELDKIDELDESNPLGIPVHHGGPYEAIQKIVQPKIPHNIGSQYQDQPQKPQISKGHPNYHTAPPPIGVSLNLTPGQVLPRNFQQHYLPQQNPGKLAIRNRLHESLPSRSRGAEQSDKPFENITPKWSNHHFSLPAEESQQWQKHNAPYEQSGFGPAKTGTRLSVIPNSGPPYPFQPQIKPHARTQYRDFDADLSRENAHDTNSDDSMIPTGPPQRTPGSGPNSSDATESNQHPHALLPPDQENVDLGHYLQSGGYEQPSRATDIVHHQSALNTEVIIESETSSDSISQVPSRESRDRDVRSLQKTIISTNGSSRPQDGGRVPQPRHLPKRLVMPTPLQPSQFNALPSEQVSYALEHSSDRSNRVQKLYSHQLSPPSAATPAAALQSDKSYARAQEIPMSQGRKLKKRSILGIASIPPPPALSFEPTITSTDSPHGIPLHRDKPDKAARKVLSKRRVDL